MSAPKDQLPSVQLRMRAGAMLVSGETNHAVAEKLGISLATVKRYRDRISTEGLVGLEKMGVGGRRSALDADALNAIRTALGARPQDYGLAGERWTSGNLGTLIEQRYGAKFSRVYVRKIIIDLGFGASLSEQGMGEGGGAVSVLDAAGFSWIAGALRHSPKAVGFETDQWTNERLRKAIQDQFGVHYSRMYVWKIATDLGLAHRMRKSRK
jgi:transposase